MRVIPELRALCGRVRGQTLRMVIGGALMVPAAVLMAIDQLETVDARQAEAVHQDSAADGRDAVVREWGDRVLERERELVIASFAREFDISLSLAEDIHEAAVAEKIAPRLAFGLVKAESSFRTNAVSPVGAVGLTQLLPSTARWLVPGTSRRDLFEP